MFDLREKDILILCGGLGKRLRPEVSGLPKVLADIDGRPFLGILLDYLETQGFKRVILATGYKSQIIEEFCRNRNSDLSIEFCKETEPLGTGGAVKNAKNLIKSDPFFALNGDCFCQIDYKELLNFHTQKKARATLSLCEIKEKKDFGSIAVGESDEIVDFTEKASKEKSPYVSAGIYCFNRDIFDLMPERKTFSIETEFFPNLVGKGFFAFKTNKEFIDIGTPKRYKEAKDFLKKGR